MTSSAGVADRVATGLGRAAAERWARPGPAGRPRPAPLGSVAAAAMRFSAGIARPPKVRRQLAGPGEIRPGRLPEKLRPPRWWSPTAADSGAGAWGVAPRDPSAHVSAAAGAPIGWGAAALVKPDLPARGLRRAAKPVPTEGNRVPGGMAQNMAGSPVPVRRLPDVRAAGAMKGAESKLVVPRSVPARPSAGADSGQPAGRGAAGPPGVTAGDGVIRRSAVVPRVGVSSAGAYRAGSVESGQQAAGVAGRPGMPGRTSAAGNGVPGPVVGRGWIARRVTEHAAAQAVQRSHALERPGSATEVRKADRTPSTVSTALRRSWARPAPTTGRPAAVRADRVPQAPSGPAGASSSFPAGGTSRGLVDTSGSTPPAVPSDPQPGVSVSQSSGSGTPMAGAHVWGTPGSGSNVDAARQPAGRALASAVRRSIGGGLRGTVLPRAAGALPGPDVAVNVRRSASGGVQIRRAAGATTPRPPAVLRSLPSPTGPAAVAGSAPTVFGTPTGDVRRLPSFAPAPATPAPAPATPASTQPTPGPASSTPPAGAPASAAPAVGGGTGPALGVRSAGPAGVPTGSAAPDSARATTLASAQAFPSAAHSTPVAVPRHDAGYGPGIPFAVVPRTRGAVVMRSMAGPRPAGPAATGADGQEAELSATGPSLWLGARPSLTLPLSARRMSGPVEPRAGGSEPGEPRSAVAPGVGSIATGAVGRAVTVRRSQFGLGPSAAGAPVPRLGSTRDVREGGRSSGARSAQPAVAARPAGSAGPVADRHLPDQSGRHRTAAGAIAGTTATTAEGVPGPAADARRTVRRFATGSPLARAADHRAERMGTPVISAGSPASPQRGVPGLRTAAGSRPTTTTGHQRALGAPAAVGFPVPGTVGALLRATRTVGVGSVAGGLASADPAAPPVSLRRSVSPAVSAGVNRTTQLPARSAGLPPMRAAGHVATASPTARRSVPSPGVGGTAPARSAAVPPAVVPPFAAHSGVTPAPSPGSTSGAPSAAPSGRGSMAAARWSMIGPTLSRSVAPLGSQLPAAAPINSPAAGRSASVMVPAMAAGSMIRRTPALRSAPHAVDRVGMRSAFVGSSSIEQHRGVGAAASGRPTAAGSGPNRRREVAAGSAPATTGTTRSATGPAWFGGPVSTPIQAVRVPGTSAPTGMPIRRSRAAESTTSRVAARSGASGQHGSTEYPDRPDRGTRVPGRTSVVATGVAIPLVGNTFDASVDSSGALPGARPRADQPWFAPSIRRRMAPTDREIEPSTRSLLARPPVVPPRSAPRGVPTDGGQAAAVQAATAALAPPFALRGAAGGPPVPNVAEPRSAAGVGERSGTTIRRSLLDQAPASLFERARSQLSGAPPGRESGVTVRRTVEMNPLSSSQSEITEQGPGSIAASLTPREWDQLVDIIVERLEDRVSDELARRGRRFTPGVM